MVGWLIEYCVLNTQMNHEENETVCVFGEINWLVLNPMVVKQAFLPWIRYNLIQWSEKLKQD